MQKVYHMLHSLPNIFQSRVFKICFNLISLRYNISLGDPFIGTIHMRWKIKRSADLTLVLCSQSPSGVWYDWSQVKCIQWTRNTHFGKHNIRSNLADSSHWPIDYCTNWIESPQIPHLSDQFANHIFGIHTFHTNPLEVHLLSRKCLRSR